jgi:SAM-dependent methyltransferase
MKQSTNSNRTDSPKGYSASHLHKGPGYERRFTSLPGRRLMWRQEKSLLTAFMKNLPIKKENYLDFASGTGRILAHVGPHFATTYALDISEQMLSVAQEKFPAARFVTADFRENPVVLQTLKFDLITAFRFFPNAEPELRDGAMSYIAAHLHKDGYLILNNHRTYNSTSYRVLRLIGRLPSGTGMHHREMVQLANKYALQFLESYSLGIVPQTERRAFLPWSLTCILEKANRRLSATRHHLGYNTIYIFQQQSGGLP